MGFRSFSVPSLIPVAKELIRSVRIAPVTG